MTGDRARILGAEALGTFALVLFGCGAIMVDAEGGSLGHVGISLAFGLVVMAMVYAFAHVSGAHINPAVTLALATRRRLSWASVPGYWGAQVTGAIAAAIVLRASLGDVASLGATTPSGSDAVATWRQPAWHAQCWPGVRIRPPEYVRSSGFDRPVAGTRAFAPCAGSQNHTCWVGQTAGRRASPRSLGGRRIAATSQP